MAEIKQVESGAKAQGIGTVKTVVGEVKAVDAAGNERILQAGDKVHPNETIVTAAGALVLIEFVNGSTLDLPSSSQIVLDNEVFNPALAEAKSEEGLTAEQIQEMIARGEDPTAVTEATAAGAGAGDEGGSSFIVVDFNNTQGNVTSGFNTIGIPGPESTTFTELPPVEDEPAPTPVVPNISVSVGVGVDIGGEPGGGDDVTIIPGGATIPSAGVTAINIPEGTSESQEPIGTHPVTFIITLDQVSTSPVTVTYTIVGAGATEGEDYKDGTYTGIVTIPAGAQGFTVTMFIVEDDDPEANENFQIVLSNPIGATLVNDTATVTIVDDDVTIAPVGAEGDETDQLLFVDGNLNVNYGPDDTGTISVTLNSTNWEGEVEVSPDGKTISAVDGSWTLVVKDDGTYTFTQHTAITHPIDTNPDDPVNFEFKVQAEDSAGNLSVEAFFTITVDDDGPTADPDSGDVTEGDTLDVDAANGVLADDTSGADGWAPSGAVVGVVAGNDTAIDTEDATTVGVEIDGDYGTLTLYADGSYKYVATADAIEEDATDVFVYTVKDGDGDLESTTLTINLADVTGVPTDTAGEVNEAGLAASVTVAADGTDEPSDSEKIVDGDLNLQLGWTAVTDSGTSTYGTWSVNANGTFTYTLTANTAGNTTSDSFEYTAEDEFGNTVTNTVSISIVDDAPLVDPDSGDVTEGDTLDVDAANGVLADDTSGADGWAPSGAVVGVVAGNDTAIDTEDATTVGVEIDGDYGTLTLYADGSYKYVATADAIEEDATDVFVYTVKDGDGDLESTTLTINLADVTLVAENGSALVDEAALTTGTNPASTAETDSDGQLNVTDAVSYAFKTGTDGTGSYGMLTLDSDGSYSYTLTSAMDSGSTQGRNTVNGVETFYYIAMDVYGNTVEGTITVDIKDDVPVATDAEDASVSTAEGATDTGSLGIKVGADLTGASVALLINGEQVDGQQVLDTSNNAVTSGGNPLYYFSDGAGGLYVATEEGGESVLEITPVINGDGTTSYKVEVTGLIDHNIDNAVTDPITVTVTEYGSETITITGDFTAGTVKAGSYKPTETAAGGTINGYDADGNFVGTMSFSFRGFSDSDSTANQYVFNDTESVSVSGANVAVASNQIDNDYNFSTNANSDGDGELLKITFSETVTKLDMLFDQLDTGETAYYSIDQGLHWIAVDGTLTGGSQSSDESISTGLTSGFTELWIRGSEGSQFGILINTLEATWTEEVPTETEHTYNVSIIDVVGENQTVIIDAQVADGDDDLSNLVDFNLTLDSDVDYDSVSVTGSTVSNFSAEQGDQIDFSEIFGDSGMSASELFTGGYLTVVVNETEHTATISVDLDAGGATYSNTQVLTLTNLDAGVSSTDIINQIITQQPTP